MSVPDRSVAGQYPPDPIPRVLLGASVNLLAGAPNVGKTALMASLLAALRDNQRVFGHQPSPLPSIALLSVDRSWHQSSKLWFDLAGFGDIPHYCLQDDPHFNVDKLEHKRLRLSILRDAIDQLTLPWGALLAIDPIAPFLGGNLNDYDACMVACTRIRRLCRERGLTVLGVSHAGKQKNDAKSQYVRLQDRIIGSAAQFGYTDTQMYLASPDETGEKFYTFMWNPHHLPAEFFPLGRASNGLFLPWEDCKTSKDEQRILQLIPSDSDIGFAELIVASETSKATVWRYLQELIKEGHVEKVGHGRYRKRLPS